MRVLHIATLFTPNGEFGGPTRVATLHAVELSRRGHQVTLTGAATGWRSPDQLPADVDHRFFTPGRSIPGLGVAGVRCPAVTRFVAARHRDFDIAHIHLARDLVTVPAARAVHRAGLPYVLQCHGMVQPTARRLAHHLDRAATLPLLTGAERILTLTSTEEDGLAAVARRRLPFHRIVNGVPVSDVRRAHGDVPEVLFLARLDERKRPVLFVHAAAALLDAGVRARFTLVGPDGGQAASVDDAIARSGHAESIRREPPVDTDDVPARMARASVYVLPSVDEPFPMTVLEAMSVAVPVVVTDSCGLAPVVSDAECGAVVTTSQASLQDSIGALLSDAETSRESGMRGRERVRTEFSVETVGTSLESVYRECIAERRAGTE